MFRLGNKYELSDSSFVELKRGSLDVEPIKWLVVRSYPATGLANDVEEFDNVDSANDSLLTTLENDLCDCLD
jgi:hypothetical protein